MPIVAGESKHISRRETGPICRFRLCHRPYVHDPRFEPPKAKERRKTRIVYSLPVVRPESKKLPVTHAAVNGSDSLPPAKNALLLVISIALDMDGLHIRARDDMPWQRPVSQGIGTLPPGT